MLIKQMKTFESILRKLPSKESWNIIEICEDSRLLIFIEKWEMCNISLWLIIQRQMTGVGFSRK